MKTRYAIRFLLALSLLSLVAACGGAGDDEAGDIADELGVSREAITVLPAWEREDEPWDDPCHNPSEATVYLHGIYYGFDVIDDFTDWYSRPLTVSNTTYTGESYPWGPTCSGPNQTGNIQLRPPHAKDKTLSDGRKLYYMSTWPDTWTLGKPIYEKPRDAGWFWTRKNWSCSVC